MPTLIACFPLVSDHVYKRYFESANVQIFSTFFYLRSSFLHFNYVIQSNVSMHVRMYNYAQRSPNRHISVSTR